MKIGIFSGTFDPIHLGHIAVGNAIVAHTDLQEVWFVVSPQNPFKQGEQLSPAATRLHMVQLAVATSPKLKASDFEFSLPTPSYTIDTLHALQEAYPQHQFTLIVGADNWATWHKWKDSNSIVARYSLLVYPRTGYPIAIPDSMCDRVEAFDWPLIDISSTAIRKGIAERHSVRQLVSPEVYHYIVEQELYKIV